MAIASHAYAKGYLAGSGKEWYHGVLTKDELNRL